MSERYLNRPDPFVGMRIYSQNDRSWMTVTKVNLKNKKLCTVFDSNGLEWQGRYPHWLFDTCSVYSLPGEKLCPQDPKMKNWVPVPGQKVAINWNRFSRGEGPWTQDQILHIDAMQIVWWKTGGCTPIEYIKAAGTVIGDTVSYAETKKTKPAKKPTRAETLKNLLSLPIKDLEKKAALSTKACSDEGLGIADLDKINDFVEAALKMQREAKAPSSKNTWHRIGWGDE